MNVDFRGRTVVITGGSRGIGRASCLMFAACGANVVFGYRSDDSAANQVRNESQSVGNGAVAVRGDVRSREAFEALFDKAREVFGGVDIAVANAGIWKRAPIDEMTEDQWQETLDVNLKSVYYLCHFASREMKRGERGGNIVLVGSTAGQRGEANYSHYAATKGAIQSLTKSLAAELGPHGIRVNCVAPGWVDTDMTVEPFARPGFRKEIEEATPLRKVATAGEVASAIVYLASDMATHVQGEILNVNGGSVLCG